MNHWQTDLLGVFIQAKTAAEVFTLLASAASDLGYERCAYGLRSALPLSRPRVIIHDNYAEQWRAQYLSGGYLERDPTVRHAANTCIPLAWSAHAAADDKDQAFWAEARDHGLSHGWCQSTLDRQGLAGMLTLARACEPLSASELAAHEVHMRWLVNVAHVNMTRVYGPRLHAASDVRLSSREIQVLQWTGDGKTSSEIAEILALSVDTVNHHIGKAVHKLQCANKTAAVVKAVTTGLLM